MQHRDQLWPAGRVLNDLALVGRQLD
jgi:hypothetical protein